MTRLLLTSVFLLLTAVINAQKLNLDDLYHQVDQEIEHFPEYVAQYEQQIAATRTDYQKAKTSRNVIAWPWRSMNSTGPSRMIQLWPI